MKMLKIIVFSLVIIIMAMGISYAADVGTTVITYARPGGNEREVVATCTAHTDGTLSYTLTATDLKFIGGRWLCSMYTDPDSSSPPTTLYDLYLKYNTVDLLGGTGVDRSATDNQLVYPQVDSISGQKACVPIHGALEIAGSAMGSGGKTVIRLSFDK